MARPDKKQVEKMKRQDKELGKLPGMSKEEKLFKERESYLKRLIVPERVEAEVKKLAVPVRKKRR